MANRHTIVLMQNSQNRSTRTFMDYDSTSQAMDGICTLYERKLKDINPANRNITYVSKNSFSLLSKNPLLSLAIQAMANRHTIVLMQNSQNRSTRTFMDYDSTSQAMDGICTLYERKLKDINPANRNITYDIADLYNFIDGLSDMSALVYDHSIQAYLPNDRRWIKQRLLQHLKKLANK